MGKLVAIGGGEIKHGETLLLDKHIIYMAGKDKPKVLFIPTASRDAGGYINIVKKVYHSMLGCDFSTLLFFLDKPAEQTVREKIEAADIIYVGGGNTELMMRVWSEHGVDVLLRGAYERGCVMAGLSAGAICWFANGYSDSDSFSANGEWSYKAVAGLGFVNACVCPHYNEEGRKGFDSYISCGTQRGLALENRTAFCLDGDLCMIKRDDTDAAAYMLAPNSRNVQKQILPVGVPFSLEQLEAGDLI